MAHEFRALDEAELLERVVDDGYWCYEISDERGVTLRFSFNL